MWYWVLGTVLFNNNCSKSRCVFYPLLYLTSRGDTSNSFYFSVNNQRRSCCYPCEIKTLNTNIEILNKPKIQKSNFQNLHLEFSAWYLGFVTKWFPFYHYGHLIDPCAQRQPPQAGKPLPRQSVSFFSTSSQPLQDVQEAK